MNKYTKIRNILIGLLFLIILAGIILWARSKFRNKTPSDINVAEENTLVTPGIELIDQDGNTQELAFYTAPEPSPDDPAGTEIFLGFLEGMDTGCFAEGACFIMVDGRKVIVEEFANENPAGTIEGIEDFRELFNNIGSFLEVKALRLENGDYTLYGSEDFYVKAI